MLAQKQATGKRKSSGEKREVTEIHYDENGKAEEYLTVDAKTGRDPWEFFPEEITRWKNQKRNGQSNGKVWRWRMKKFEPLFWVFLIAIAIMMIMAVKLTYGV